MTDFTLISNEALRGEIEEFVTRPAEIERSLRVFSRAHPRMQAIAVAVIEGEHHLCDRLVREALAAGHVALEIMDDGLIAGMGVVGIKFRENFIFVPEVLACARAMKSGMVHIEPILSASGVPPAGKVVMGTVKGDLHDIGKNLCIMMLRGRASRWSTSGWTPRRRLHRRGRAKRGAADRDVALLTTTVPNMGRTIEAFIDAGLREDVQIMVGGRR